MPKQQAQARYAIVWLQQDLRLADNPGLHAALTDGCIPIPTFILPAPENRWAPGAASRWWLHHSLNALQSELRELNSDLLILKGDSLQQLQRLTQSLPACAIYRNRSMEPATECHAREVIRHLASLGLASHEFTVDSLFEPEKLLKADGTPYRVFTPFWRCIQRLGHGRPLVPAPSRLFPIPEPALKLGIPLSVLPLLSTHTWHTGLHAHWQPGERAAQTMLEEFTRQSLSQYAQDRELPGIAGTARLSPYLHFGELSVQQAWESAGQNVITDMTAGSTVATESFQRQLAWREFARHLLWHTPDSAEQPMDRRFNNFPWRSAQDYGGDLRSWQLGQTGIPLVDAGMRELWATGWMHNRVRMIVASFLVKNLLIPWQEGARWFWDTLVDADLANNTMGWQWVAGCGVDAAPYFRIFNPITQGERFDRDGVYVKRWVPELSKMPSKWLHHPWDAPIAVLQEAGLQLDKHYPPPIVDLKETRARALEAYAQMKEA